MAKSVYKVPSSLDSSFLDVEIAIRGDSGMGLRPLPMRLIVAVGASFLLWWWSVQVTPVGGFGMPFLVVYTLVWIIISILFLRPDKSGGLMIGRLPILIQYLPKSARKVSTRTSDLAGQFYSICNLDTLDEDRGIVRFADGDVGYLFRVVGTGSVLLFDEDRDAVLDRVDAFYRKMGTDYELIYITVKEAQNVRRQIAAQDARIARAANDDPDLYAIAQMDRTFLADFVGKEFKSIQQYLIIKAYNTEALAVAYNLLQGEVEGSSLMFKRCQQIYDDDLKNVFRTLYQARPRD